MIKVSIPISELAGCVTAAESSDVIRRYRVDLALPYGVDLSSNSEHVVFTVEEANLIPIQKSTPEEEDDGHTG
jgi:hypothetical protein